MINHTGTATTTIEASKIKIPRQMSKIRLRLPARLSASACVVWDIFGVPFASLNKV
jgi:hypothetical protein